MKIEREILDQERKRKLRIAMELKKDGGNCEFERKH